METDLADAMQEQMAAATPLAVLNRLFSTAGLESMPGMEVGFSDIFKLVNGIVLSFVVVDEALSIDGSVWLEVVKTFDFELV